MGIIGDKLWNIQYLVDERLLRSEDIPAIPAFFANPDTKAGMSLLEASAHQSYSDLVASSAVARRVYRVYSADRRRIVKEVPLRQQWNAWYGEARNRLSEIGMSYFAGTATLMARSKYSSENGGEYSVLAAFYRVFCRYISPGSIVDRSFFSTDAFKLVKKYLGVKNDADVNKLFLDTFYRKVGELGLRKDDFVFDTAQGVIFLKPNVFTNPLSCGCTCLDWRFMFSYPGKDSGVTYGGKAITYVRLTPPPPGGGRGGEYHGGGDDRKPRPYKNPKQIVGICKHVYFLVSKMIDLGLVSSKRVNYSQEIYRELHRIYDELLKTFKSELVTMAKAIQADEADERAERKAAKAIQKKQVQKATKQVVQNTKPKSANPISYKDFYNMLSKVPFMSIVISLAKDDNELKNMGTDEIISAALNNSAVLNNKSLASVRKFIDKEFPNYTYTNSGVIPPANGQPPK